MLQFIMKNQNMFNKSPEPQTIEVSGGKIKKYLTGIAFLTVLIVADACRVSQNLEIPKADVPVSFRNSASNDSGSVANLPWKSFFPDVTLQQLIDSAVVKNYDMQLAVKNIEAAQLIFNQTKWSYFPDARVQLTGGSNRPSDNSLNGISASQFLGTRHIEDFTTSINLSWEADIWGKIRNQNARILAEFLQTDEARKAVQTRLVAGVAQGYFNLLMLDEQLAIAKRNFALNDSTLQIIRLQHQAGQVTLLAVQQAEAQQLVAAGLVPQLEQNIIIQENALKVLTGALPDKIERNAGFNALTVPENLSAGIPSSLVGRRPDVRSNELALNVANAKVGVAKANMYPSLTITAAGGINSFKASNWFNIPASLFGTAAAGIAQPVFMKKQLQTQYQVALVEREKTVLYFKQSVLNAVGEVSDALVKIEKLKVQQDITANRVNTLQQAIPNADMLFKNGMATYLEVINAQSNVLQSELEQSSIKRARLSAMVDLYRSLGGGWK